MELHERGFDLTSPPEATLGLMMTILVLATAVPDIQVAMSLGGSLGGTLADKLGM